MANLAGGDHAGNVHQRTLDRLDHFEGVELRVGGLAAPFRDEEVKEVVLHRRVRQHPAQRADSLGLVAGLLAEFAGGGDFRRFAVFDQPAGRLQRHLPDAVAELADQDHVALGRDRHDVHPRGASRTTKFRSCPVGSKR